MKELFAYLSGIPKSSSKTLIAVLLLSTVIAFATYLLFMSDRLGSSLRFLAVAAVVFYSIWFAILYFLQRKDIIRLKDLGLSTQEAFRGMWAGLYIFLGVNLIFLAVSLLQTQRRRDSREFPVCAAGGPGRGHVCVRRVGRRFY